MGEDIATLYEKFRTPLLRFLRYKLSDEHVVEDLLHEVFIKAGRSIDDVKEGEKIQSWLYAVAANTVADYYRKQRIPLTETVDTAGEEAVEESVIGELSCCLRDFIATLPEAQRRVLEATYEKEQTLEEFAAQSGRKLSTLKSDARRARQRLKRLLEECCSFESNARGEMVDFVKRRASGCSGPECGRS